MFLKASLSFDVNDAQAVLCQMHSVAVGNPRTWMNESVTLLVKTADAKAWCSLCCTINVKKIWEN